ncbi:MAG TPA: response regulator transcription factor [Thermoanaerobaculia bacterium]|nr:response regulator transcription factor [Thermoanaerobaculia bacterium]
MIRILIADDHAVVREGLKQIIDRRPDMKVVAEAATRDEILRQVRSTVFDVVVLDLSLGSDSGLEILLHLRSEKPQLPVLMLSMHSEEHYAERLLKAGAAGYLTKGTEPQQLVSAILKVASGGRYVSPEMAERLAHQLTSGSSERPHERLSDREFQVFERIAAGRGLTEIAAELNLSVKTVSTHRSRILEKMGASNNAQLIRYAVRHGLVD